MPVNGSFRIIAKFVATPSSPENYDATTSTPTIDAELSLTSGTADGSADLVFTARRSLGASSTETLDLAGGLTDVYGATLTFVDVVGMVVRNRETTSTRVLRVGPNAANGFLGPFVDATDRIAIGPSGIFSTWRDSGWTVTAGTGDLLFFQNTDGAGAISYDVLLVGRSA